MRKNVLTNTLKKFYDYQKRTEYFIVFMLLTILVSGLYVGIVHNQTLPFAEGWYTYYAQCINRGLIPYKDFEYLYSPIYLYLIAAVTKLFGYKLIILRRLGILFFCGIAISIFLVVSLILEGKKNWIAFIASITSVFYLQSEVVQVFYDYARLMDICAIFCVYFLLKSVKKMMCAKNACKDVFWCGVFCSLFINIKQNMGLIFSAYAFVLLFYVAIYTKLDIKKNIKNLMFFLMPIIFFSLVLYGVLFLNGSLKYYLTATGSGAISAKGGMIAILFGWLTNNAHSFSAVFKQALCMLLIMSLVIYINKKKKWGNQNTDKEKWLGFFFFIISTILLLAITFNEGFAREISSDQYLSPYLVFLIVVPFFILLGIVGIYDMIKGTQYIKEYMLYFTLVGAYFAISFGCGNSGGLAEGQASLGIAFIVTFFLVFLNYKIEKIFRVAFMLTCVCLVIQCADKKMIYTYNWWGMDESSYWESRAVSDLPLLQEIGMSIETKDVYEKICEIVIDNTTSDDTIFCFPQIPIFYSLCDRRDPGTTTKVQWFDVSTDKSVEDDISVIKENPPAAIIIYNTLESAYTAHESSFRKGQMSGTREMREFLYNFVYENGYTFAGRFQANNNTLQIWVKEKKDITSSYPVFSGGTGTIDDPYLIESAEQLLIFSKMVNDGRDFSGEYIRQTKDIDLNNYRWIPIGEFDQGSYFYGTYDGSGHTIKNIHLSSEIRSSNVGFFGQLGGSVYNLGIENGATLRGACVGAIASHSIGGNAKIINCYSNTNISAYRAGGIADNFAGEISNCISLGNLVGTRSANAVSYGMNCNVSNVYISRYTMQSKMNSVDMYNKNIIYCDDEAITSGVVCDELNNYVNIYNSDITNEILLHTWSFTNDKHLTLE